MTCAGEQVIPPRAPAPGRARLFHWGPVVLQMAFIFGASSIPDLGPLPAGVSAVTGHGIGHALLGALLLRALAGGRLDGVTWSRAIAAILLATLYGVSDELHQTFVPGRSADRFDVLADCLGATLAVTVFGVAARARAWGILKSWS